MLQGLKTGVDRAAAAARADLLIVNSRLSFLAESLPAGSLEQIKSVPGVKLAVPVDIFGAIMAIGATLGAVNSLYAIVDARRRELGTLRAMGFGSSAIVASVLCESLLFALPGATRKRSGMVVFQRVVGESLRLQLSTDGDAVSGADRHRLGFGDGLGRRPSSRAAGCKTAGR